MDINTFSEDLLQALAKTRLIQRVTLQTEGPIVNGYAYVREDVYLRFYYNENTDTMAFALIAEQQRIWGIDHDNLRGWHIHPAGSPTSHVKIESMSVPEIVLQLEKIILMI